MGIFSVGDKKKLDRLWSLFRGSTVTPTEMGEVLDDAHAELHTVASHSDTTATGTELESLTDGSNADSLHDHAASAVTAGVFPGSTESDYEFKEGALNIQTGFDLGAAGDPYIRVESPRRGVLRFTNTHGTASPSDSKDAWIEFDRENTKWGWQLNAGGGGLNSLLLYFNSIIPTMSDNRPFIFGGQSSCSIQFRNASGSDGGFLAIRTKVSGNAECTGVVAIQNYDARYDGNTSDPLYPDPHLRVYGGGVGSTQWIESYHDQTDGHIKTGTGNLKINPAGGHTDITGTINAANSSVPASASATGIAGTVAYDSSYIYVCTATDTWMKAAIATW